MINHHESKVINPRDGRGHDRGFIIIIPSQVLKFSQTFRMSTFPRLSPLLHSWVNMEKNTDCFKDRGILRENEFAECFKLERITRAHASNRARSSWIKSSLPAFSR